MIRTNNNGTIHGLLRLSWSDLTKPTNLTKGKEMTNFGLLYMVTAFEKAKTAQLTDEQKVIYEKYKDNIAAILTDQTSWNIMNELNRGNK